METNLVASLFHAKFITQQQKQHVFDLIAQEKVSPATALTQLAIFNDHQLADTLSQLFNLNKVDVHQYQYQDCCQDIYQRALVLQHRILPLAQDATTLYIGLSDPTNIDGQDDFRFTVGKNIEPLLLENKQLEAAIGRVYGNDIGITQHDNQISNADLTQLVNIREEEIETNDTAELSPDNAPITRYINQVLMDALRRKASDIHFEPYEKEYRIRFRCDGILHLHQSPPIELSRRLSTRLKVMAKLNIAERRKPQDGRIKMTLSNTISIDLRVSTLPTLWGEKVVLRILNTANAELDINSLGYNEKQKNHYLDALKQPQGMILMTGPTGSGKTVSLYTGLNILNTEVLNISTAEDPVEINLSGINQVQINPVSGIDFSDALRTFLRQDPDVIMVGEIRDIETASIAIKASQTGHLVLSTLHTNSAAEAIIRLTNMGIDNFNLVSSLSLIIAQRLARRLCPHCKQSYQADSLTCQHLALPQKSILFKANNNGCDDCNKGYRGRVGIYEVMPINREISEAIMRNASSKKIEDIATHQGMLRLKEAGIEKLVAGITSLFELHRVLQL